MFDTLANLGCDDLFCILVLNCVLFLVGAESYFIVTCANEEFFKLKCGICNPEEQSHLSIPTINCNMYYLGTKHSKNLFWILGLIGGP